MHKILPNTTLIGRNVLFLPTCHSTNDTAAHLSETTDVPEGTVVATAHQTAGRGQRGNQWEAEPGKNLTFSVLLRPAFMPVIRQFQLTVAVSSAIHRTVSRYVSHGMAIKWPNDVYYRDKKMGGILIENTITGSQLGQSIVGIGLNVNQTQFTESRAVSLRQIAQQEFDLETLLTELLERLDESYVRLRLGNHAGDAAYYHEHLYRRGATHPFRTTIPFTGEIVGVDDTGRLGVKTEAGLVRYFQHKEIEFI